MAVAFGSPTYSVQTSFTQPPSAYQPYSSPSLNSQLIGQQNAQLFGNSDLRSLMQGYLPSSNSGVSNDYTSEQGMMSLLNAPRSQAASQAMQNRATGPYQQQYANWGALLGEQAANAGQAFGIGGQAQNLGQAVSSYNLGNLGGNLGLVQGLLSHLFGGIGNLTNGAMGGGLGSLMGGGGYGGMGGMGSIGSGQIGIPGLQTG